MKRVLLAIFFCLFMCNVAHAQCAWILWEKQYIKNEEGRVANPGEWGIVSAYPKYDQCLERQKKQFVNLKEEEGYKLISIPFESVMKHKEGGKFIFIQELKCLPDTIDPRR